ncbi:YcxB family protein [Clostridium sp. AN503]|uniref:YcxB family protein n=1 Tax=Clostridium sp. AN503 TaxID=3160598 RepID=UPI003458426D
MGKQNSFFYVRIERADEMPVGMWKLVFQTMFSRKIWFSKSSWKVWAIWAFLSLWLLSSMSRWLPHFEHMLPRLLVWVAATAVLMAAAIAAVALLCIFYLKHSWNDPEKRTQFCQDIWFYEDHILVEKTSCTVEIPCVEIADIKEQENQFILQMNNGNTMILPKKSFLEGNPSEFCAFMQKSVRLAKEAAGSQRVIPLSSNGMAAAFTICRHRSMEGAYAAKLCETWSNGGNKDRSWIWKEFLFPFGATTIILIWVLFVQQSGAVWHMVFPYFLLTEGILFVLCLGFTGWGNRKRAIRKKLKREVRRDWNKQRREACEEAWEFRFYDTCFKKCMQGGSITYGYENIRRLVLCGQYLLFLMERPEGTAYVLDFDMREVAIPEQFCMFIQERCGRKIEEDNYGERWK